MFSRHPVLQEQKNIFSNAFCFIANGADWSKVQIIESMIIAASIMNCSAMIVPTRLILYLIRIFYRTVIYIILLHVSVSCSNDTFSFISY